MHCSPDDDHFDLCTSCQPFKYLSPASQIERISRNHADCKKLRKALMKYEDFDVDVDSEQDVELQELVTTIDDKGQSELEKIFAEAGECGDELRNIWAKDVELRKEFFQDQLKNSE